MERLGQDRDSGVCAVRQEMPLTIESGAFAFLHDLREPVLGCFAGLLNEVFGYGYFVGAHHRCHILDGVADVQFGLRFSRQLDCTFEGSRDANPDLWSNTIFGSPGYLHFHTCGDYPPGEICWMVAAPTVTADGRAIWRGGALCGASLAMPG